MDVLVLSNCPVVEYQGSGYNIINTARSLSALGNRVEIIPPSSFLFIRFLKNRGHIYHMALGMARWVFLNRKSLLKYELMILYGAESALAVFLLKAIFRVRIPVILHSNGLEVHVNSQMKTFDRFLINKRKWYNFDIGALYRYCYRNVDAIITVSKYDFDFAIVELHLPESRVYYIEPCLPDLFFKSPATEVEKKSLITYCGTWIDRKGIDSIKGAIPRILRKYPDYNFRIIGVGDTFQTKDHFPGDIVHKVEVYPMIKSKERMIQLLVESSIFLFPSFCESFGLVVAEAMFCRCAVITGPTGFASDLKNSEEALILETPDTFHVYQALDKLILDPELREVLGKNAKKRTDSLKWSNYQAKLGEIIQAIFEVHNASSYEISNP